MKQSAAKFALKAKSSAHFSRGYRQASERQQTNTPTPGANTKKTASVYTTLHTLSARYATPAFGRLTERAIIAGLSDKDNSYNYVEMTQKSCFLMVADQGFGHGAVR